jgi:hypothetical protein
MDTQNIDQLFRKALEASERYYDAQANEARARIWKQVRQPRRKNLPVMFIALAAACLLLMVISGFLGVTLFSTKQSIFARDSKIEQLSVEIAKVRAMKKSTNTAVVSFPSHDTVYVAREKIAPYQVEVSRVVTDTVYVQQTVYVEKEAEPLNIKNKPVNDSVFEKQIPVRNTEILISKADNSKKTRLKKFKIRLGGEKEQSGSGSLALIAKY